VYDVKSFHPTSASDKILLLEGVKNDNLPLEWATKKKSSIEKGQYHKYSIGKGFFNGKPLKSYIGEGFGNIENIPMEFLVLCAKIQNIPLILDVIGKLI